MPRTNKARAAELRNFSVIKEDRAIWTTGSFYDIALLIDHEEKSGNNEPGPTVTLLFKVRSGRTFMLTLSNMTEIELDQAEAVLNLAIDIARPICQLRDRSAEEAYENGDDSIERVYRQVPRFIARKGSLGADGESLLQRLDCDALGLEVVEPPRRRVRADSKPVAQPEPKDHRPKDDAPSTERVPDVRQVGGLGESPFGL